LLFSQAEKYTFFTESVFLNRLNIYNMKSILYAGATLMIGASIYGFVDYKKTSRNKEFTSMYAEKKTPAPEVVMDEIIPIPAAEKKDAVIPAANTVAKTTEPKSKAVVTKKTVKKVKKKRTFNTRLFSRGALDERYIEPVKTEEKKNL
jgi:hypothetical protein